MVICGSGTLIQKAIKKYGNENFEKKIIFFAFDYDALYWAESHFVDNDWVSRHDTYNVVTGGCNPFKEVPLEKRQYWGSIGGAKSVETKSGVHSADKTLLSEWGKRGGTLASHKGKGIHSLSKEDTIQNAKKGGAASNGGDVCFKTGKGIHSASKEQRQIWNAQNSRRAVELKSGVLSASSEELSKWGGTATLNKIFINDGIRSKTIPKSDPIPSGWVKGRLKNRVNRN